MNFEVKDRNYSTNIDSVSGETSVKYWCIESPEKIKLVHGLFYTKSQTLISSWCHRMYSQSLSDFVMKSYRVSGQLCITGIILWTSLLIENSETQSTSASPNQCMTPCECGYARQIEYWSNVSNQEQQLKELEQTLVDIRRNLTLAKDNLTTEKIKLFSAEDSRQSSKIIGIGGLLIILAVPVFLLAMDFTSVCGNCSRLSLKNKLPINPTKNRAAQLHSATNTSVTASYKKIN